MVNILLIFTESGDIPVQGRISSARFSVPAAYSLYKIIRADCGRHRFTSTAVTLSGAPRLRAMSSRRWQQSSGAPPWITS